MRQNFKEIGFIIFLYLLGSRTDISVTQQISLYYPALAPNVSKRACSWRPMIP